MVSPDRSSDTLCSPATSLMADDQRGGAPCSSDARGSFSAAPGQASLAHRLRQPDHSRRGGGDNRLPIKPSFTPKEGNNMNRNTGRRAVVSGLAGTVGAAALGPFAAVAQQ